MRFQIFHFIFARFSTFFSILSRHGRGVRFADPESAAALICGKKTALQAASRLKTLNLGVSFTVNNEKISFPPNFQRVAVALRVPQTSTLRQNEVRPSLTAAHAWWTKKINGVWAGGREKRWPTPRQSCSRKISVFNICDSAKQRAQRHSVLYSILRYWSLVNF